MKEWFEVPSVQVVHIATIGLEVGKKKKKKGKRKKWTECFGNYSALHQIGKIKKRQTNAHKTGPPRFAFPLSIRNTPVISTLLLFRISFSLSLLLSLSRSHDLSRSLFGLAA